MYTEAFKDAMVVKMTVPGGVTASVLSKETGVSQPTLSKWKKSRAKIDVMSNEKRSRRRPQDWSGEEKLKAIIETAKMSEEELGSYLRREGLHSTDLEQWSGDFLEAHDPHLNEGRKARFVSEEKKKIKELEREVRRKDKALAEATALPDTQKKPSWIWGLVEDDESA